MCDDGYTPTVVLAHNAVTPVAQSLPPRHQVASRGRQVRDSRGLKPAPSPRSPRPARWRAQPLRFPWSVGTDTAFEVNANEHVRWDGTGHLMPMWCVAVSGCSATGGSLFIRSRRRASSCYKRGQRPSRDDDWLQAKPSSGPNPVNGDAVAISDRLREQQASGTRRW